MVEDDTTARPAHRCYVIGESYVDKGSSAHDEDEFLRWVNIPSSGMRNSPGIRPLLHVDPLLRGHGLPAYLILVTHEHSLTSCWRDTVDLPNAEIHYWGDARHDAQRRMDDFEGNGVLRRIWDCLLADGPRHAPPILHFSKPRVGLVEFSGLCVMDRLESSWFSDGGRLVQNYRVRLGVLDCQRVSLEWLHHRARAAAKQDLDAHPACPDAWRAYVQHGVIKRLQEAPARVEDAAPPVERSEDWRLLSSVATLPRPGFEALLRRVFCDAEPAAHRFMQPGPGVSSSEDLLGRFHVRLPVGYAIGFRMRARQLAPASDLPLADVEALARTLGPGEHGIYVTTGSISAGARNAVVTGRLPVRLVGGVELVRLLRTAGHRSGPDLDLAWIAAASA